MIESNHHIGDVIIMLKANNELAGEVFQLIAIDPDRLIELGNRLKQLSMDSCIYRESILVKFTDKIMFVYTPEKEFTKPVHTYNPQVRIILNDSAGETIGGTA